MNNVVPFRPREQEPEPGPTTPVSSTDRLLIMLNATQERGMTWRDVAAVFEMGHGSASGLLSRAHKAKLIVRLAEEREGSRIYVTPDWVMDRTTEAAQQSSDNRLLGDMAAMLSRIPAKCRHQEWRMNCRSCEIRALLIRYADR